MDFKRIYVQERVNSDPIWRSRAEGIVARFPAAEVVPVGSHWKIGELFDAD